MTRSDIVQLVVLGLLSMPACSQGVDGRLSADQHRRLVEQKLRLVESLVNSPAAAQAVADGRVTEASELLLNGRKLLDRARETLLANRLDEASATLDEALRNATKVALHLSANRGALSTSVQQANHRNLSEQVTVYRNAIEELANQGNSEAKYLLARIGALQLESGKLVDAGRMGDANRKLADAYKLAVEAISKLRAGQTVTLSLKFNTPVEEYDYERRRFQSSEILVDMMAREGRADGDRRNMVDSFVREARRQLGLAAEHASGGDYKNAVALMETATTHLNRALQVMGVPIF